MSTSLIPLDGGNQLPAHLRAFASEGNEFGFSGVAYPSISIKGKVFTIVRDKERTLVITPDGDGAPAPALEVVVVGISPKQGYARTFFAEGFVEGSTQRPSCFSDDGVSPVASSTEKQANKCALCPQNAKGSGATQQNPKAKACKSSKVLAVTPAGQLNDPMMLRVPGQSLIALGEYGDFLAKRGVKAAGVVTRIGFDYSVAHPSLTFKAVGGVTPEMAPQILATMESEITKSITGEKATQADGVETQPQLELPLPTPVVAVKPAVQKTSAFSVSTIPAAPAAPAAPAPAAPKAARQKAAKVVEQPVADAASIDEALGAIDFDD